MKRISKDDIRTLIVVVIVCVLCLTIFFILNHKSNSEKLEDVSEYNTFFNIVSEVNKYLSYSGENNSEALYELLSKDYVKENNINLSNILNKLELYPTNSSIKVSSIKYVKIKSNYSYYVTGKIIQNNYDNSRVVNEKFQIIVNNDFNNRTFSIHPIDDNKYEKIINNFKKINIVPNRYNIIFNSELITKEQICVMYLSDYVNRLNEDINNSYSLLSDKAKEQFPNVESYITYINSIRENITTVADKCAMEEVNNQRVYHIIDNKGNSFNFYEEKILNYKVDFKFVENE